VSGGPEAATPTPRTALFVVVEPGEFVELSRVASALQGDGFRILFFFSRPDYVSLSRDTSVCRKAGFEWVEFEDVVFFDEEERSQRAKRVRLDRLTRKGYFPLSLVEDRRTSPEYIWSRLRLLLLGGAAGAAILAPLALLLWPLAWVGRRLARLGRRAATTLTNRARPTSLGDLALLFRNVRVYGSYLESVRTFLDELRPAIVVLGQEYVGSMPSMFAQAARDRGIPALLVPFSLGTPRELSESLYESSMYRANTSLLNKALARLAPHWVHVFRGARMVRLPGSLAFALERLGLSVAHPWIPNFGFADRLAIESPRMLEYYRGLQFGEERLVLTGSITDDVLAEALRDAEKGRQRLAMGYGRRPRPAPAVARAGAARRRSAPPAARRPRADRPYILCALPPNQLPSRAPYCDMGDYGVLVTFWFEALSEVARQFDYNVLVRPHPVTRVEVLQPFAKLHNLRLTVEPTAALVPLCHIFVSSVSSTIRWAVACGIPVVNYDVYKYGYTDFDDAAGVLTMTEMDEFTTTLRRLAAEPEFYGEVAGRQRACADRWGALDGGSTGRLLRLVRDMTAGRSDSLAAPRRAS
jgi:hypothetical protein